MKLDNILSLIRSKTRSEWTAYMCDLKSQGMNWVQNNGQIAGVGGLVAGIFITIFYKLVILLLVLAGLGIYVIWYLAEPGEK